ncbi:Uncharacterised protein [Mycobacteroides abscessus subsp. abscessus]|nr:Uncharacterised protein [Mycobacteroides abscessus]SHZ27250.1 Uncharacterised protein [Mycobacteroides abscessus subsp. abscessus]
MVDKGWAEPKSITGSVGLDLAAVDHDGRSGCPSCLDVGRHPVPVSLGYQWAHIGVARPVTRLDTARPLGNACHQLISDRTDRHRNGNRHTTFTGRAEAGIHQCVRSQVEIGIGEDHRMVLRAAQRLYALARSRRRGIHVLSNWCGTDEADGFDGWVCQKLVDNSLIPLQHVEYSRRHTCLGQ